MDRSLSWEEFVDAVHLPKAGDSAEAPDGDLDWGTEKTTVEAFEEPEKKILAELSLSDQVGEELRDRLRDCAEEGVFGDDMIPSKRAQAPALPYPPVPH